MDGEDDIREKVVSLFREHGYGRHEEVPEDRVRELLEERSQMALGRRFKPQLLDELLEQCKVTLVISPFRLGTVVEEAMRILSDRIRIMGEGGMIEDRATVLAEKRAELESMEGSPQKKTSNKFKQSLAKQIQEIQNELEKLQSDNAVFQNEAYILDHLFMKFKFSRRQHLQPIEDDVQPENLSKIFYLNCIASIFQVFNSALRPSFLCWLYYLHVFYLLFVGYYHRKSGMLLIFQNLFTLLADIGFFVLHYIFHKLNSWDHSIHLQGFMVIIFQVLLGLGIIIRLIQLILLYPFKQPPKTNHIIFHIFRKQLSLHKRIKTNAFRHSWAH